MFKKIGLSYRNIKRYRKIVEVLIKHGFGYLIETLDLQQYVPLKKRIKKINSSKSTEESRAIRLRKVLEELGPTYIKLGQLLSTRPDLIPRKFVDELEKLQDQVPPMSFDDVMMQINQELSLEKQDLFEEISPQPLASASIGQVHQAVLKTGEEVVIKIQRQNIQQTISSDLDIISNLAGILKNRVFSDDFIDPVEIIDNFSNMIKQELDYQNEARNMRKFYTNFSQKDQIIIPNIFWDLTTKRVFTMEFIEGEKINNLDQKAENKELAEIISRAFMKQIMDDGFFHADPHPGNFIITQDQKVALIDFGLVGQLSKSDRERVANLFINLVKKDIEAFVDDLLNLGMLTKEIDIRSLKRDFYRLLDDYYGITLEEVDLSIIMNRLLDLTFKYKIKLPIEFILLIKSLVTIEGVVAKIDPKFNILEVADPFAYEIIKKRLSPQRLTKDFIDKVQETSKYLTDIPEELHKIFKLIQEDKLEINFHHLGINPLISKLDIITNRLSISLIISALVIGSSLVMLTEKGPSFLGFPIVGISGYLVAMILGIWLVISILRSGRF